MHLVRMMDIPECSSGGCGHLHILVFPDSLTVLVHSLSTLVTFQVVLCCAQQVEKAPLESYADVGGLEQQVTEIKEAVELPLTPRAV
jgi:hypothetical protein